LSKLLITLEELNVKFYVQHFQCCGVCTFKLTCTAFHTVLFMFNHSVIL